MQQHNPEFAVHFLPGRRLDAQAVLQACPGVTDSLVYVSGPSRMVDELAAQLTGQAHVPPPRLMRDWFTGRPGLADEQ
jgi:hypothetical protein